MAVIEGGTSGELQGVGVESGVPAHIVAKGDPFGTLGHYRVAVVTGTLAAALAAAAQLFQFKWTDATRFAVIHRVRATFLPLTLFTAATLTDATSFGLFVVRSYTAGGGGTALTLTGNNAKQRASMGTTLVSEIRIASTAALTAATTLDAQAVAVSLRKPNRVNPAAATEEVITSDAASVLEYIPDVARGEHPLVLSSNEGLVIANRTGWPAAGTGILSVELAWSEVSAY